MVSFIYKGSKIKLGWGIASKQKKTKSKATCLRSEHLF